MINVSFDLKDKKAARIFGQAMIDYSGETDAGKERKPDPLMEKLDASCKRTADSASSHTPAILDTSRVPDTLPVTGTDLKALVADDAPTEPPVTDENGVEFDAQFCGKAKVPFYSSGKNKGQWKRKQRVDEKTYDAWYAAEHIKAQTGPATQIVPVAPNTAAAFGGQPEVVTPPVDEQVDDGTPQGAGEMFKWISEQMNAGNLTQPEVDSAYPTAGISPADLFSGDATEAVAKLYGALTAVIAA